MIFFEFHESILKIIRGSRWAPPRRRGKAGSKNRIKTGSFENHRREAARNNRQKPQLTASRAAVSNCQPMVSVRWLSELIMMVPPIRFSSRKSRADG